MKEVSVFKLIIQVVQKKKKTNVVYWANYLEMYLTCQILFFPIKT